MSCIYVNMHSSFQCINQLGECVCVKEREGGGGGGAFVVFLLVILLCLSDLFV